MFPSFRNFFVSARWLQSAAWGPRLDLGPETFRAGKRGGRVTTRVYVGSLSQAKKAVSPKKEIRSTYFFPKMMAKLLLVLVKQKDIWFVKISEDTFRMILKEVDFKGVNFLDLRFVFSLSSEKGVLKQKGTGWGRSFPLALSSFNVRFSFCPRNASQKLYSILGKIRTKFRSNDFVFWSGKALTLKYLWKIKISWM